MRYISTRGGAEELSFEDVLLKGLATDGGLYVPKVWPQISLTELEGFVGLDYQEIAYRVMKPFIDKQPPGAAGNVVHVVTSAIGVCEVVPTSGAGMSLSSPINSDNSCEKDRDINSNSFSV